MGLHLKSVVVLALSFLVVTASAANESVNFKKKIAKIGKKTITVEIAETSKQLEHGLMYRKKLAADSGMLFIFPDEQIRMFWMKNTLIDLSIGYFNKQKKLIDIHEMKATSSVMQQDLPGYASKGPAMFALEMDAGWYKKNKIELGAEIKF